MLFYIKWVFRLAVLLLVGGCLHYTLPQRDIVRVVNTEIRRVDVGDNSWFWAAPDTGNAPGTSSSRDVRFINAIAPNGKPRVYRNEDTGWGWPPYFKIDSSNLQAEATDMVSTKEDPDWVILRHYGWRSELLSTYPNAVGVAPAEGPDQRLIPWLNIFIIFALICLVLFIYRMIEQFYERMIAPLFDRDAR